MHNKRPPLSHRTILALIMAGVILWGIYVAVGAYRYNLNPWRPVIVLACIALFVGTWLALLWNQNRTRQP